MRRLRLVVALFAACRFVDHTPAHADPTWTYLPSLPSSSDSQLQLFVDGARHRYLLVGEGVGGVRHPVVWAKPIDSSSRWIPLAATNTPTVGVSPSIIFDPIRDRLVLWDPNTWWLWTTNLTEPLVWSHRAIANGANVREAGVAYDARHRRMLLFSGGGMGQASTSDVLGLPLDDDQAVWSALPAYGTPPEPRLDAIAIVDTLNDRLVIHGGRDFSYAAPHIVRGDVWALSLSDSNWTPLCTTDDSSSVCYTYHSAVYDPIRQRMLLFGGASGDYLAPVHPEVRAFSLDGSNAWSIAAAPDPTRGAPPDWDATAYDPESDAVIEYDPDVYSADERPLMRLALSPTPAWSVVEAHAAKPPWRFGQATAFDPVGNRWLSFGGRLTYDGYNITTETYQDLWSLRIADRPDWQLLTPGGGEPPPERQDGRMLYDPGSDRMILFGGQVTIGVDHTFPHNPGLGTPHFYGDTWALQLRDSLAWSQLVTIGPAPGPRDGGLLVLDTKRNRVLLFGGRDSLGAMNDVWALSLSGTPAWTQLAPGGAPPSPRYQMFGCYDFAEDRLVVAGGVSASGALLDAFALPLSDSASTWTALTTLGTPATMGPYPRPQVFDPGRRRILVFGDGSEVASSYLPAWTLDIAGTLTWAPLVANGAGPAAAYGYGAAYDPAGDRVLLAGGTAGSKGTGTTSQEWLLSFGTPFPITGVELSSLVASAHRVDLDWHGSPAPGGLVAGVERSAGSGPWQDVGAATITADGRIHFTDTDVAPSLRYGYRLRIRSSTMESVSEVTWVTLPGALALALEPPRPNPSVGFALVSFDLPRPGRADLSVYDIGGRRLEHHDMDAATPGRYTITVGQGLRPGLYFVRLSLGNDARTSRLCIVK
jgi:hypothetical protein